MSIIQVWCVHTNESDGSWRDPTHFFSSEIAAKEFAKGNGYYGGDAHISTQKAIVRNSRVYLIEKQIDLDGKNKKDREELRKKAIAKLTPEEIKALNIKEND